MLEPATDDSRLRNAAGTTPSAVAKKKITQQVPLAASGRASLGLLLVSPTQQKDALHTRSSNAPSGQDRVYPLLLLLLLLLLMMLLRLEGGRNWCWDDGGGARERGTSELLDLAVGWIR